MKIFESTEGNVPLPTGVSEVLGLARRAQGRYYITAETKAIALEYAEQAFLYATARTLRMADLSNGWLDALRFQGKLLAHPGMIVTSPVLDARYALWSAFDWAIDHEGLRQRGHAGEWQFVGEAEINYRTHEVVYTPLGL